MFLVKTSHHASFLQLVFGKSEFDFQTLIACLRATIKFAECHIDPLLLARSPIERLRQLERYYGNSGNEHALPELTFFIASQAKILLRDQYVLLAYALLERRHVKKLNVC